LCIHLPIHFLYSYPLFYRIDHDYFGVDQLITPA
jgi:hypothetical protein